MLLVNSSLLHWVQFGLNWVGSFHWDILDFDSVIFRKGRGWDLTKIKGKSIEEKDRGVRGREGKVLGSDIGQIMLQVNHLIESLAGSKDRKASLSVEASEWELVEILLGKGAQVNKMWLVEKRKRGTTHQGNTDLAEKPSNCYQHSHPT